MRKIWSVPIMLLAALAWSASAAGPARSCAEIHEVNPSAGDGEYIVVPDGDPMMVYCEDMDGTPRESVIDDEPFGGVVGKESCRDDGWKLFGVFKTQGDCVSFFASKGKNFPG